MSKKNINVEIVPRNNESVERLLKRFTRKLKKEGIIQEVRDRRYYEKPSAKKAKVAKQRKKILDKLKRERDTI
jgi:small subunit ribosomal protein S21|tara:strand:- start:241 stop:459 length:219 start_codon:yes stop_codon:yes gene_type:complete